MSQMHFTRMIGGLLLGSFAVGLTLFAGPDDGLPPKEKKGKGWDGKGDPGFESETGKMMKLIEKSAKGGETEREKFIKELRKFTPPANPSGNEFADWFEQFSGGQKVWERAMIRDKPIGEIFDRIADHLGLQDGRITREQFITYANTNLKEGSSVLWKQPKEIDWQSELEKIFKDHDRNGDGLLSTDEMPEALARERDKWDTDRDGFIHLNEYKAYFPNRFLSLRSQVEALEPKPREADAPRIEEPERPRVYRSGHLPDGLPAWFAQLDDDRDGQVGLYEWKSSGWPLDLFRQLDLNDDGLLEPHEVLKQLHAVARDGTRPFADLATRKLASNSTHAAAFEQSGSLFDNRPEKKEKKEKGSPKGKN